MNTVAINHRDWYSKSVGLKKEEWDEDNKTVKSKDSSVITILRTNVSKFAMANNAVARCLESLGAEGVTALLELGTLVPTVRHMTSGVPEVGRRSNEDIILQGQEFVARQQRPTGIPNELNALGGRQAAGGVVDAALGDVDSVSAVGSRPAFVDVDPGSSLGSGLSSLTTGTAVEADSSGTAVVVADSSGTNNTVNSNVIDPDLGATLGFVQN